MGADEISLGRLVAFYTTQMYYTVAISILFTYFILPEVCSVASDLIWKVFVERRFLVVVFLLCLACVVSYIFQISEEEKELTDLPITPVLDDLLLDLQFPLPDLPPYDPPYLVHSSFSSSSVDTTPPPSSPAHSGLLSPYYSDLPSSSHYSSTPEWLDSPLMATPPPPPFKMKPWKFFMEGDYVRMASDVSLSSDYSDHTDVDAKADKFITEFKSRLKSE